MIRAVTGFLIDMDGVVYRGSKMIRGAADFIAQRLGFRTVLVLSGGTKRADLDRYAFRPTTVVNSIQDLIDHDILGPVMPRQPDRQIA